MANHNDYDALDQELADLDVETNFLDEDDDEHPALDGGPHHRSTNNDESSGLVANNANNSSSSNDNINNSQSIHHDAVEQFGGGGGGTADTTMMSASVVRMVGGCLAVILTALVIGGLSLLWKPLLIVLAVFLVAARWTIPDRESFDARAEIRRIENNRRNNNGNNNTTNTKKNWWRKKASKVQTLISTGAKSIVGGYDDVQVWDVGIGLLVIVRDLTTNNNGSGDGGKYYTWLGCFGKWRPWDLSPAVQANLHEQMWRSTSSRPSPSSTTTGGVV